MLGCDYQQQLLGVLIPEVAFRDIRCDVEPMTHELGRSGEGEARGRHYRSFGPLQ